MQKIIKNYLNAAIAGSAMAIILGILLLVFPAISLDVFRWIIAIMSFTAGVMVIVTELSKHRNAPLFGTTAIGAVLIVVGLIFAARPAAINIFSIILGAWFIVTAIASLRFIAALKGGAAFFTTLMAIISAIAGFLLITNPWGGSISMMILLGITLIVFGVSTAMNVMIFKGRIDELDKKFKAVEGKITASKKEDTSKKDDSSKN